MRSTSSVAEPVPKTNHVLAPHEVIGQAVDLGFALGMGQPTGPILARVGRADRVPNPDLLTGTRSRADRALINAVLNSPDTSGKLCADRRVPGPCVPDGSGRCRICGKDVENDPPEPIDPLNDEEVAERFDEPTGGGGLVDRAAYSGVVPLATERREFSPIEVNPSAMNDGRWYVACATGWFFTPELIWSDAIAYWPSEQVARRAAAIAPPFPRHTPSAST